MYRTTISSRPRPAPELGDSDQMPLFDNQVDLPASGTTADSKYPDDQADRPKLSLVRADENAEDREQPVSIRDQSTEEACEPIELEESDSTKILPAGDIEPTAEHPRAATAEEPPDLEMEGLGDLADELESSLEDDLAMAEADLRAIAAELEEDINASTPMHAESEAEPQAVILDDEPEPPPAASGCSSVASGTKDSAERACRETVASTPLPACGPDDTTVLRDDQLVEEEVEVLDEDSNDGIEWEPAIGPSGAGSPTVTGRPMPALPARGEMVALARKGVTGPRPPKRIGGGRLVPTRLTWKPGEPAGLAKPRPKAGFRWETMLTTACITAVCGMGCLWLLRTILA